VSSQVPTNQRPGRDGVALGGREGLGSRPADSARGWRPSSVPPPAPSSRRSSLPPAGGALLGMGAGVGARASRPGSAAPPAPASRRGASAPRPASSGRGSLPGAPVSGRGAIPPVGPGARRAPSAPHGARRSQGSWLARFRLLTGIIVVITASVVVAWGLRRYLQSSPRFAIRTVRVEGNARRTAHQVAERAGVQVGKNIFATDIRHAKQAVEADEWIEQASVSRELPNTIRIGVNEREPRALASIGGQLFLVDGKGQIFKTLKAGDPNDWPVVTGIDAEQVARDRDGVTQRLRRVVDLLADLERVGIARRYPVQEIHLQADDTAVAIIGSEATILQLGRPPYRAKVEQADRILVEIDRRKAKPDVIFLDDEAHPERVVARMR